MKIEIETPDNGFECVLISAVRYAIGRRTYMPAAVTRWIGGHCYKGLSRKTLEVLIRDIDEAKSLGDECDVRAWMDFRAWLQMQLRGVDNGAAH